MSIVVKFVNGIIYFNTGCLHGKTGLVFCKISQDIHVKKLNLLVYYTSFMHASLHVYV